jgi:hypothetical protein
MYGYTVSFEGTKIEKMVDRIIGDKKLIENASAEAAALQYKWKVRRDYLSGQVLRKRTGWLWEQWRYKKIGHARFWVYPGQAGFVSFLQRGGTITPNRKKALRFVTEDGRIVFTTKVSLRAYPFINDSFTRYTRGGEMMRYVEKIIVRMLTERGVKWD